MGKIRCWRCHGTGKISENNGIPWMSKITRTCWFCNRTGYIDNEEKEKEKKNGNKKEDIG